MPVNNEKIDMHRTLSKVVVSCSLVQRPNCTWRDFTKNPCHEQYDLFFVGLDLKTIAGTLFKILFIFHIYEGTLPHIYEVIDEVVIVARRSTFRVEAGIRHDR